MCQKPIEEVVVLVDAVTTGAFVGQRLHELGYKIVHILSNLGRSIEGHTRVNVPYVDVIKVPAPEAGQDAPTTAQEVDYLLQALKRQEYRIIAVVAGAETGVEVVDGLAHRLGLRGNDPDLSLARRSKFHMHQAIAAQGLRSCRQLLASTWEEAAAFLRSFGEPLKVIVKPTASSGSDGVFKCTSMEEAKKAFDAVANQDNVLGGVNTDALIQEYLEGVEYVVDSVSLDGVHKTVAVWEYEKGPSSDGSAAFVNLSNWLLPASDPKSKKLIEYSDKVLDAVGIKNGAGHMEVKLVPCGPSSKDTEPCLVEVGSRVHGLDGTWMPLAKEVIGYTQVEAYVDSVLRPEEFEKLPSQPELRRPHNRLVDINYHQTGALKGHGPGEAAIRGLPSFFSIIHNNKPQDSVRCTTDCLSIAGYVHLVGDSQDLVDADAAKIRHLETGQEIYVIDEQQTSAVA